MQQSRRVLFGSDPLGDVKIDLSHFRLQLEHELKSRLLLLRQRYLAAAGDAGKLANLLTASVSTFLVLFRAALRLYDEAVPKQKAAAWQALAQRIEFDPQPILAVLALKEHKTRPAAGELHKLFGDYLASIERVVLTVDRHLHQQPS